MIELSLLSATAILNNCKRFAIGEIRGAARDPFWTTLERIKPHLHDTTGCQSGLLNEQLFVQHGCQTRLTTGCIVYTNIQPVVSCKWGLSIHNFSDIDVSTEKKRTACGHWTTGAQPRTTLVCLQYCFPNLQLAEGHYTRSRSLYAIARPSVVCNVRAPYPGGSNFRQYFYGTRYLGHQFTSAENITEIVPGEPLRRES